MMADSAQPTLSAAQALQRLKDGNQRFLNGQARFPTVQKEVLAIANEYWVSFSFNDYLYDKKYVFVPGSLDEMNFTEIPFLNRKGVMIR